MAPAVPFVVLIGNAIVMRSEDDLMLVEAAMDVMQPVAADSPAVKRIHGEVGSLHNDALAVMNQV